MLAGSVLTDTIEGRCNPVDEAQPSHFVDDSHHIPNCLSLAIFTYPFKQVLVQFVLLFLLDSAMDLFRDCDYTQVI